MRKRSSSWVVLTVVLVVIGFVGLALHLMGADLTSWTRGMRALHGG